MAAKPRLGRGLNALISQGGSTLSPEPHTTYPPASHRGSMIEAIAIDQLDANPHQPRAAINPADLAELIDSIRVHGILEPVLVTRKSPDRYELIAGHRRTAAAKAAGLASVPAIVRDSITPEQQTEWALVENIHREDLNPVDKAKAYRTYIDRFHLTHNQAGERLGQDRATISNHLRILDLDSDAIALLQAGAITFGHAKVLVGVTAPPRQRQLAQLIVDQGLSVRELERLAAIDAEISPQSHDTLVREHARSVKSAHVVELEQELSRKLGTKLRIFPSKRKGSGKLVIQYYSLDEFDRIVDAISGPQKHL